MRVPGAAQHEVVRCRPGTVTERRQVYAVCASLTAFGGPGPAVHRYARATRCTASGTRGLD